MGIQVRCSPSDVAAGTDLRPPLWSACWYFLSFLVVSTARGWRVAMALLVRFQ